MPAPRAQRGFSIIELVIVMLVFAILVRAAAPAYATWMANTRIRTAADSIYGALQLARQEAIRRNARVQFALTDAGGSSSWQVCPVGPGTLACDPAQPIVQARDGGELAGNTQVGASTNPATTAPGAFGAALAAASGVPASVIFDALGRPVVAAGQANIARIDVRDVGMSAADERRLVIVVSAAGSPRLCDPKATAGTPRAC